jgi:hypothetical protein
MRDKRVFLKINAPAAPRIADYFARFAGFRNSSLDGISIRLRAVEL